MSVSELDPPPKYCVGWGVKLYSLPRVGLEIFRSIRI